VVVRLRTWRTPHTAAAAPATRKITRVVTLLFLLISTY